MANYGFVSAPYSGDLDLDACVRSVGSYWLGWPMLFFVLVLATRSRNSCHSAGRGKFSPVLSEMHNLQKLIATTAIFALMGVELRDIRKDTALEHLKLTLVRSADAISKLLASAKKRIHDSPSYLQQTSRRTSKKCSTRISIRFQQQ